jgi:hypothetical protein
VSDFKEFCLVEGLSPVQIIGARKAWNHQQAKIDAVKAIMNEYYTGSYEESAEMAGLISAALEGDHAT